MSDKNDLIDSGVLEEYTTIENEDVKKIEEEMQKEKYNEEKNKETEELDINKVKIKEKKMYIKSLGGERGSFDSQDSSLLKKSQLSESKLEESQFLIKSDSSNSLTKLKDGESSTISEPIVPLTLSKEAKEDEETLSVKLSSIKPLPPSPQNLSIKDIDTFSFDEVSNNSEEATYLTRLNEWYLENRILIDSVLIISGGISMIVGGYFIHHRLRYPQH